MESNFKLVMGAAIVGIFLGVAGLVFGIVSKNKADELRSDFSLVQDLVDKIQQVEESSSGISAGAGRIKREVDSLREGTQGALNQVSDELTRLRRDLNDSIALARGLEQKLSEFANRSVTPAPAPVETFEEELPDETAVASNDASDSGASGAGEVYVIRGGDNLSRVAAAHGVSLDSLMQANPGVDPLRLQIGQEIRIPPR